MTQKQVETALTEAFRAVYGACPCADEDFEKKVRKSDHA